MHIVQLVPELNEGGVERGVVDFNCELVRRGHTSIVISNGGRLVQSIIADGGEHIQLDIASKNIISAPFRALALRRLLKQLKPDIVHARSRVPAWLAYLANSRLKIPFITTVHGFNSVNRYSKVMTYGDRVICASKFLVDHIIRSYGTDSEIIRLIPRGVNLEYFDPNTIDTEIRDKLIEKYGLKDKKLIVQIARITQWKDQETVIKAFISAKEVDSSLKLLLVGSVDETRQLYYSKLKELADSSPVKNDIVFTGNLTCIKELLSIAQLNISASSSKPETFGRANVEGLLMGVPLLATRIGATVDYVVDGVTGFFFEPGNHKSLANLIIKSLHHEFNTTNISTFAKENFSLEMMVNSTLEVYRQVLTSKGN